MKLIDMKRLIIDEQIVKIVTWTGDDVVYNGEFGGVEILLSSNVRDIRADGDILEITVK